MPRFLLACLRKPASRALCGVLLLVAIPTSGRSAAPGADIFPLAEIRPGMRGYGLTVFEGTRIDTFAVEVIGVQQQVRAAGSLLLVRVSGHDLERSSIAQGMSGSPVFLEGRLAGALAFGWPGALSPIAGVTPAAEILALPGSLPAAASPRRAGAPLDLQLLTGGGGTDLARDLGVAALRPSASEPVRAPAALPAGWPAPETLARLLLTDLMPGGDLDGGAGWICRPLGSGAPAGQATAAPAALAPGSACAVPLVTGDAQLGAIGTVTWVQDDRVFMMGHPFMQRGPVDLPLAGAEILTVFPSREISFKMGSVGPVVGSVHHDQRAGLSGRLGPAPRLVPVEVEVLLAEGAEARRYRFAVVEDPQLTPTLVFWALYNALLVEGDDASGQTLRYRLETTWEGPDALAQAPLVLGGAVAGPGGVRDLAGDWMAPLAVLLNNPFAPVRLTGVRARLSLSRPMADAVIVGVGGPRTLAAGQREAVFQVELAPRQGERRTLEVALRLPEHLAPGPYRVVAASAAEIFALEGQRAAGRFQYTTLGAAVELLRSERSAGTLVVALLSPGRSLVVQGRELSGLPGSVDALIRTGNLQADPVLADYAGRCDLPTEWVLAGHAIADLRMLPGEAPRPQERRP